MTAKDNDVAQPLMDPQSWLEQNSRDVLDESDEILDVRFQLVYTLGIQRNLDGQPHRWLLTQLVLDLFAKHAIALQVTDSKGIEVNQRTAGSFPEMCIRSTKIAKRLVTSVLEDVMQSRLPHLNLQRYSSKVKDTICAFLWEFNLSDVQSAELRNVEASDSNLMKKISSAQGHIRIQHPDVRA